MKGLEIDADQTRVMNNLSQQIARLSRENAVLLAAVSEAHEKIKELEGKQNPKKK